jgi:predicted nucleic acid-binding protein
VSLVLDCSATLAWIFPDETTLPIRALFAQVIQAGAFVPDLWRLEVANCLTVAVRRGRITAADRRESLTDLNDLPISIDNQTGRHAWTRTVAIADKHSLTVYDATYLELAMRLSFPLATLDADLRKAAKAEGVALLGM